MKNTVILSLEKYEYFKQLEIEEEKRKEEGYQRAKTFNVKLQFRQYYGDLMGLEVITEDDLLKSIIEDRDEMNKRYYEIHQENQELIKYYLLGWWQRLFTEKPNLFKL